MEWIIAIVYLLIGAFVVSVLETAFPGDTPTASLLLGAFWPATLVLFIFIGMINLVFIAGEKVGNWLRSNGI